MMFVQGLDWSRTIVLRAVYCGTRQRVLKNHAMIFKQQRKTTYLPEQ